MTKVLGTNSPADRTVQTDTETIAELVLIAQQYLLDSVREIERVQVERPKHGASVLNRCKILIDQCASVRARLTSGALIITTAK